MIATFFEWEIHDGLERQFIDGWEAVTQLLLDAGSHGSHLFRNEAGHFCAIALWPDFDTRDRAFAPYLANPTQEHLQVREAIKNEILRIDLDSVSDFWRI